MFDLLSPLRNILGLESKNKDKMATLNEQTILATTKQNKLSNIKALDVSNREIDVIEASLLNKMPLLEILLICDNNLTQLPLNLELRMLRKLDASNNNLEDVAFVEKLTALREINLEGNSSLDTCASYKAIVLCPSLEKINGKATTTMKTFVQNKTNKLENAIKELWEEEYAYQYEDGIKEKDVPKIIKELTEKALKLKAEASMPYPKFRTFLITRLSHEIVEQVQSRNYVPPTPHKKVKVYVEKKSNFTVLREKSLNTPKSARSGKRSAPSTPVSRRGTTPKKRGRSPEDDSSKSPLKSPSRHQAAKRQRMESVVTELDAVSDYNPIHFLRCHFGDREAKRKGFMSNDPKDNLTRIWAAAFEPDKENKGETTSTVATCGGNTVCLIDCGSGRVTKRFTQPKEHFFALTWTTITLGKSGKKSNILAVGGWNGHIRLLHPDQLVCYKEIGNSGRPNKCVVDYYVCSMMFHPEEPTLLFSGSSDATITLFDIGIPQPPDYEKTEHTQLHIFDAPSAILNLAFTRGMLIGGCEDGCYGWKLSAEMGLKGRIEKQKETVEFLVPKQEDYAVDALTLVGEDLIATRSREDSSISIWRVSSALKRQKEKKAKVKPLLRLAFPHTEEMFLSVGASYGLLGSGDDQGNLHLYNTLDKVVRSDIVMGDAPLEPSRILLWPDLFVDTSKEKDSQMKDVYDIKKTVMNCVAISSQQDYIVGGTDSNILCIWKRM